MSSNDLLTGNIPSTTSSKQKKGTKRLNRKPLLFAGIGVVVFSALVMSALSGMSNKGGRNAATDDSTPMPTNSFVNDYLANRTDGVIGDDGVQPAPAPVFPIPEIVPVPEVEPVVPAAVPVVDEPPPPEPTELEIMLEKQRMADLMARMEQERLAKNAPSSVNFNRTSVSEIIDEPDEAEIRREETKAQLVNAEKGLSKVLELIEMRMKADGALTEQPIANAPLPLPVGSTVDFEREESSRWAAGSRGGAGASRGGFMRFKRQTDIKPESSEERVPDTLQNEFLLRQREADDNYLNHSRVLPITNSEIQAGTVVRANLVTGINSELPGQIIAQVSRNVFDSQFGEHVLIPQGAKLIGEYRDSISFGDNRILVAWDRLLFPDGTSINLEGMAGVDVSGYAGFRDQVNNHWGKLFTGALFLSVISSGVSAVDINTRATDEINTSGGGQSIGTGSLFAQELSKELAKIGTAVAERALSVQPTIIIRPGYQFAVMVNKDIILPPYVPIHGLIEPRYAERDVDSYTHPVRPFGKRGAVFDSNSVRQIKR